MTRSNSGPTCALARFERVAVDREREVGDAVEGGHRDATLVSCASDDRRAALLRADRGTGAGGDAAGGGRVRAPARLRRRLRQAARAAARDLAGVDRRARSASCRTGLRRRGSPPLRCSAAAGALAWWRWRPPLRERLHRRCLLWSEGLALVAFAGMALLVAYSPDVWQTEKPMDMAFINAAGDADSFPPEDPWMAGEDLNYYYLGHLMAAGSIRLSAVAPTSATTSPSRRSSRSRWSRRSGSSVALAGRRRRRACGASGCARGGHDRRRARAGRARRAAAHLRLVRRLARDRGHDQRVPRASRSRSPTCTAHVMAIPFSLLALAFGLQVALAGPAAGAARAGRARAGVRRDRDRDAVRDQRLVVPGHRRAVRCSARWCGCGARPACASACGR